MTQLKLLIPTALLCFAVGQSSATQISFSGSTPTSGTLGNTRSFSKDGINVLASAESLIGGAGVWQPSYLGNYGGGLGVTNSTEGSGGSSTHTVDNIGSYDRVVFSFSTDVILDRIGLTAFGDTDITTFYFAAGVWSVLGNDLGGNASRTADINAGSVSASRWAVSALYPASVKDDSFKLSSITFDRPPVSGPPAVPEAGYSLVLLALGMGVALRLQRRTENADSPQDNARIS